MKIRGLFFIVSILLVAADNYSQSTAAGDAWRAAWNVNITGDFTKEPEFGSQGPVISNRISRQYSGNALLKVASNADQPKSTPGAILFKNPDPGITIKIDDFARTAYDPICDEFETIEDAWKAESYSVSGTPLGPALLLVNNSTGGYKTSVPLIFEEPQFGAGVEYVSRKFINRNGKSTPQGVNTKRFPLSIFGPPAVKGSIFKGLSIMLEGKWSELQREGERQYWISEILHPDEPLISGVPESKDGVNIVIYFSLTRLEKGSPGSK